MLEHAVDDPTDTERWLDDVRRKLLLLRRLCLLGETDHFLGQDELFVVDLDLKLFATGQSLGQLFLLIICRVFKEFSDHLLILLKLLADDLFVEHGVRHSVSDWLRKLAASHKLHSCFILMLGQIKGRSISVTSDLDPAIAGLDLGIPAIIGVVSHLGRAMLAEANGLALDAKRGQEKIGASHEITDCLVADKATSDSLADSHSHRHNNALILKCSTPKWKWSIGH